MVLYNLTFFLYQQMNFGLDFPVEMITGVFTGMKRNEGSSQVLHITIGFLFQHTNYHMGLLPDT